METNKKIKMLVCFIHVHIGGAMTSLVNFLNALDTEKYDVDVMFYENNSGRCGIKDEINILPQGNINNEKRALNILKKAVSIPYIAAFVQDRYYKKIRHNKLKAVQIMSKQGCRFSRKIDKEYDIAIAYEFNWCMNYVMDRVKAKKKLIWHHIDMEASSMDYKIDKKAFDRADGLVFVSKDCMKSYISRHSEHKDKCFFMPNLLSGEFVRKKGEEKIELPFKDEGCLKLITAARINFKAKGLDRGINAFARLKKDGLLENVRWVILGGGRDFDTMKSMIEENGLENNIFPLGYKDNPIPYFKECDCFFLPSRYEGKPMAVTESMIMGLVPVVTEYTSAREQIQSGYDGLVFENSAEAVYLGLKELFENMSCVEEMKKNVRSNEYGNEKEIEVFYDIIEKLM